MKCEYFDIRELVPPDVFQDRGEKAWELIDDRAITTLDLLREDFGPIVVNNWYTGGQYKESGLRTPSCKTYRPYSQHTFGRAFDLKPKLITPQELYARILANPNRYRDIRVLEDITCTPTWVHVDFRNGDWDDIRIVRP